jgi:hypothetical protein
MNKFVEIEDEISVFLGTDSNAKMDMSVYFGKYKDDEDIMVCGLTIENTQLINGGWCFSKTQIEMHSIEELTKFAKNILRFCEKHSD